MHLSIKNKLLTGFVTILVLFIGIAFYMVNQLSRSNDRMASMVDVSAKRIMLANDILINVLQASRHEKNIIMVSDLSQREQYKTQLYTSITLVDRKTSELSDIASSEGKRILRGFKLSWMEYKNDMETILKMVNDGRTVDAVTLSTQKGRKLRDVIIEDMRNLMDGNVAQLDADKQASIDSYQLTISWVITAVILCIVLALIVSYWIISTIAGRISFLTQKAGRIASREFTSEKFNDSTTDELSPLFDSLVSINNSFDEVTQNANHIAAGNYDDDFSPKSDADQLGHSLKSMSQSLRTTTAENKKHTWLFSGLNMLNEKTRGDQGVNELAGNIISFMTGYLDMNIGAVYLLNAKDNRLHLAGCHALNETAMLQSFGPGEGYIGQAAAEKRMFVLSNIESGHLRITSTLLDTEPKNILVVPLVVDNKVIGVMELGGLGEFTETHKEFISISLESISISLQSAEARRQIQELLEETQAQGEELQSQQEELVQVNEELEEQAQHLKQQQEELVQMNEELEEKTYSLERQHREMETAKNEIEQKSKELHLSNKYKSEFLANMSHELRTPLNSLLILSKDLGQNSLGNLNAEQVESADIIYNSGRDLLVLINEILDLSKIEAGKIDIIPAEILLMDFVQGVLRDFRHQGLKKGLQVTTELAEDLPETIYSDPQRLGQVMKNLMSNAIKFTEKGSVHLSVQRHGNDNIILSVTDTGIGIAADKQAAVFEAFQQADGGTARKYGGTGLGLSISRELVKLLKGRIMLQSQPGEGSTFSIILPLVLDVEISTPAEPLNLKHEPVRKIKPQAATTAYLDDDSAHLNPGDKYVLIIEDDPNFANILIRQARSKGFKCVAASSGEQGLEQVKKQLPLAIILDIDLPGISGYEVLAEIKGNPDYRHVPVHIMSVNERSIEPIKNGAIEYLEKPVEKTDLDNAFNRIENFVNRRIKNLLIVEDDNTARKAMCKLIGNGDVKCFEADSGNNALNIYRDEFIDCIVLDLGLPDMSGFELIRKFEELKRNNMPPIIIYTGRELSRDENTELRKYSENIIIKGVKSEERLMDETALFLHRTINKLPEPKQHMIARLYDKEKIFAGKKILLVDDDMRNLFSLSKVLSDRGMVVVKAENGIAAIEALEKDPGFDLVLMDIMMPEMDGYEAMKILRQKDKFSTLPIIALTAKAMKEDKQKCLDAGANDYITKPVEVDRLLSLMRIWLNH